MNSLRGRLTFSYAIVVAIVLLFVSFLACRVAFEMLARSTLDALSLSVAKAQSVAAAPDPTNDAVERAIRAASAPGVIVFAPSDGAGGPRGGAEFARGLPGAEPGPPFPADHRSGAPLPLDRSSGGSRLPPDGPPPGMSPRNPAPGPGGGGSSPFLRLAVASLLGVGERAIDVHGSRVVIAPDLERLAPTLSTVLGLFVALVALSIVLAWTIAAWLARQAVAPLVALTRELQRFAAGDFAPREVSTSERSELGALVAAFNGAAAQVTDAFNERIEVEGQMRRFIADAGHELRTPLTVITGYLEILRKGGVDDLATRERAFETLTGEAARMRVLIDRLLALARLDRPDVSELKEISVEEVAADAVGHVRAARGGDISLICSGPVSVFADPAELLEVIENVVDNAVKYGNQSPVEVRVGIEADQAVVRVRDGGDGIPEGQHARLFERFFRGDNRGDIEGTGLGLAIAHRAIARCRGRVELQESRPGRTIFTLTIPLAPARPLATAPLRL